MRLFVYEYVTATWPTGAPANSLHREGQAMLQAVRADFAAVPDVELLPEGLPFAAGVHQADAVLLIAPEIDGVLAQLADAVLANGKELLGSTLEAMYLTSDKYALAQHWQKHGVPTPRTWLLKDAPHSGRYVVKPCDGAGSQGIQWRTIEPHEWSTDFIAQEYVAGQAASVAFLMGPNVCVPLMPCAQDIEAGTFAYLGGHAPLEELLAKRALRVAQQAVACVPGLCGYVGVDVIVGDTDVAIEINPRLTTSYVGLRALCRDNLAAAMVHVWRGEPVTLRWHTQRVDFTPNGTLTQASP